MDAIEECLKLGSKCEKGPNGPIGNWDVSGMTDLSYMFCGDKSHSRYVPGAETFNGDISKWDVGLATTMLGMFQGATAFNRDISKWDVGRVTDMRWMFYNAKAFEQTLCGAWLSSTASQSQMFTGSLGKIGTATTCRSAFSPHLCPCMHVFRIGRGIALAMILCRSGGDGRRDVVCPSPLPPPFRARSGEYTRARAGVQTRSRQHTSHSRFCSQPSPPGNTHTHTYTYPRLAMKRYALFLTHNLDDVRVGPSEQSEAGGRH